MIRLTDNGWRGSSRGRWSRREDVVRDKSGGIIVRRRSIANSRAGADQIIGARRNGSGIQVIGSVLRGGGFRGALRMGGGDDLLVGRSRNGDGITSQGNLNRDLASAKGRIEMGGGNDILIGSGKKEGIRNDTVISMGDGNDEVDASRGGFGGRGVIQLGTGNDTLRGFGRQEVWGDTGRDVALLLEGRYTIRQKQGVDRYRVSKKDTTLSLVGFERIGSDLSGTTRPLRNGTLLVGANGEVGFL